MAKAEARAVKERSTPGGPASAGVRGAIGNVTNRARQASEGNPYSDSDSVRRLAERIMSGQRSSSPTRTENPYESQEAMGNTARRILSGGSGNRGRLTSASDSFESARSSKAESDERQAREQEKRQAEASVSPDDFYADFQQYSNDNLDGMGLYDFMVTDGSDDDREAWRAMTSDPVMGQYYSDLIEEAGGFDPWYDAAVSDTLDDLLEGGQGVMERHIGRDDDAVQAIFDELAYQGYIPAVEGDENQVAGIQDALAQDYQAAADLMAYNYALNILGNAYNSGEGLGDSLTLDEVNALMDYGNMMYGYGDGFSTAVDMPEGEFQEVSRIDPETWEASIADELTSRPGYGLANAGYARALVNALYGGAGYQEQDGVRNLWDLYYGRNQPTPESEQR